MLNGLYGITDNHLLPNDDLLLSAVEQALQGGMKILQYRNKTNNQVQRQKQAAQLKILCHHYQALLIINDDVDLALLVEADGVHLGNLDTDIQTARKKLGNYAIIGASCYQSLTTAQKQINSGVDYIAFGRFFASKTKPEANQANIELLTEAKKRFSTPIVAIGGITSENAKPLITAGANMIAVAHDLFTSDDIKKKAIHMNQLFN